MPELVVLPFRPAGSSCASLGAGISPRVLEDVRFTILRRELVALFGALTPGDLAAVAAAEQAGGERAAAAAARGVVLGERPR